MVRLAKYLILLMAAHFAVAAAALAAPQDDNKRVAFVVGNGAYKVAPALENPSIDAKAVSASLKRLGFQVVEGYDLDLASMRGKVSEFSDAIVDAKAVVFYYAGHGVSVDEENYLLPTDVVLKSPSDLDLNAVGITVLLKMMKRQESVNVVILDACRNNPFADEFAKSSKKTRAVVSSRGLSAIDNDLAKGTLIAFATDPKSTALDGRPGENSPFTKALLSHIEDPGVPIGTVMDRVRADVYEATHNKQTPWVNTSIIGEFFLNPGNPAVETRTNVAALTTGPIAPPVIPNLDRQAQENKLWESAERSNVPEDYKVYLDAYPNGVYAQMAKNRMARLGGDDNRSAAPAGPPKVSPAELKKEIGTLQSEKSLALDKAARSEVQARLTSMDFDTKETNGTFGDGTRAAIADWQKRHDVTATSLLGPLQLAALKQESEASYQRVLAARPVAPRLAPARVARTTPAAEEAPARRVRVVKPAPVKPQIRQAQQRRVREATPNYRRPTQSGGGGGGGGNGGGGGFDGAAAFIGGAIVGGAIGGLLRR